jgi:hypothetical protein
MKLLAFITFMISHPDSDVTVTITTERPEQCVAEGERVKSGLESRGYLVDYSCEYTSAPAQSIRPIARPERTWL